MALIVFFKITVTIESINFLYVEASKAGHD